MKTTTETITPEMAKSYLQTMHPNQRRVRHSWVDALSRYMTAGTFHTTHQGIAFDCEGRLFDGQHRLHAIILANISVRMLVSRAVDNEAWFATDIGVKRSISDITALEAPVAQALRLAVVIRFSQNTPSAEDVLKAASSPLGKKLEELIDMCRTARRVFSAAPMKLMAAAWAAKLPDSNYPLAQYQALVLQDFDQMSEASKAFTRQTSKQLIFAVDKTDLMIRGSRVFNPQFSALSKIQVMDVEAAMKDVRKLLASVME